MSWQFRCPGPARTSSTSRLAAQVKSCNVQNGGVAGMHQPDAVIANPGAPVDKTSEDGIPIIGVQHFNEQLERGSEAWQYVPELAPQKPEPLVHKTFRDPFEDTDRETVRAQAGVGRAFVAGAQTQRNAPAIFADYSQRRAIVSPGRD